MNAPTSTPANTNAGLLAMRAANAARKAARDAAIAAGQPVPARPPRAAAARAAAPSVRVARPASPVADRTWHALVLHTLGGAQTTWACTVQAHSPRSASKAAQVAALAAHLTGLRGVVAVARDDAPAAVLAAFA